METALQLAMILVSLVLMLVVLLQSRGSAFSGTFSSDSSIYRTRRGIEKTLFQLTIGLAVGYVVLALVSNLVL